MSEIYEIYRLYGAELTMGALAALLLLLLWVGLLQWRLAGLRKRYRAAMAGADGSDLEGFLAAQRATVSEQGERLRALEALAQRLSERQARQAGHVGLVRFNPFQDTGGDQSFAAAWLDDKGDGVVLSSLYSRQGVRLYGKPLQSGDSSYQLTDEEQAAIREAMARR